jgi:hypothetical protein
MNKKISSDLFAENNHYAKNLKKGHSSINISHARKKHKNHEHINGFFINFRKKKKEKKGEEEQNILV